MRRYTGTERGERYAKLISHVGDVADADPHLTDRRFGDLVDPTRSGQFVTIVNVVSRECGTDAASWRVNRLLNMVGTMQHEAAERGG